MTAPKPAARRGARQAPGRVKREPAGTPPRRVVRPPAGDKRWHPIARDLYAAASDGPAAAYAATDWHMLRLLCEGMSRSLLDVDPDTGIPRPLSPALWSGWRTMAGDLGLTLGGRRRNAVADAPPPPAELATVHDLANRFSG